MASQTCVVWWLFTVIPNMDYRTTFFGQLKKECNGLLEWWNTGMEFFKV